MAKTKGNSFEARENKSRKRSSIVKMSELREENKQALSTPVEAETRKPYVSNEVTTNEVKTPEVKAPEVNIAPINNVVSTPVVNAVENIEAPKAQNIEANNVNNSIINEEVTTNTVVEKTLASNSSVTVENDNSAINHKVLENHNIVKTLGTNSIEIEEVIHNENNNEAINAAEPVVTPKNNEDEIKDILMVDEKIMGNTEVAAKADTTVTTKINNKADNSDDFFNLSVKNDVFSGKVTTVRVYDDILEKMKKYAGMKNYQIIEFTNKVITLGLDDISNFGVLEISEIKLKNNTSRSIMYNLTDTMEDKLNRYIKAMNKKGYKISRNVILNVVLNETLKKFY